MLSDQMRTLSQVTSADVIVNFSGGYSFHNRTHA